MGVGVCAWAGWSQSEGKLVAPKQGSGQRTSLTILRRFHFSSSLKRMSCLVKVQLLLPQLLGFSACYWLAVSVSCAMCLSCAALMQSQGTGAPGHACTDSLAAIDCSWQQAAVPINLNSDSHIGKAIKSCLVITQGCCIRRWRIQRLRKSSTGSLRRGRQRSF